MLSLSSDAHVAVTGWDAFATVAGGVAGALIGLIFVAVSIRIDVISRSAELRNRAAQTLGLFTAVLVVSGALAVPDQQRWIVGIEMILIGAVTATALIVLEHRARRDQSNRPLSHLLDVIAPRTLTCLLLVVAGVLLLLGSKAGLSVMALATAVASIGGIASAWMFLIRVGGD
jgi:hypothetical protein